MSDEHADLPPAPAARAITPAPEDYEGATPPAMIAWPLLWMAAAVAVWVVLA